ncbi:MAG: DUF1003 domain-containing protein [Anaerolineae bacterium]
MAAADPQKLLKIPLFTLMDDDEISLLAEHLDQKQAYAGEVIFKQGDGGGTMYVVESGRVEIFLKDDNNDLVVLGIIEPGGIFGELSLFDNEPRSAGAMALENSLLYIIDRHDLEMLFQKHHHAALDIMAMLSRRIRDADVLVQKRVVSRNANVVAAQKLTFNQRVADLFATVAGDIRFVYACALWFFVWIVLNVNILPGVKAFDPFPFGLLTMIVSLQAIFLSTFVLVSQNRQAERDKVRNDIEYDVNVKAEVEIRDLHEKVDKLQEFMVSHLSRLNTSVDRIQTSTGQNATEKGKDD